MALPMEVLLELKALALAHRRKRLISNVCIVYWIEIK